MIEPTIGRVVWVKGRHRNTSAQPEPALITFVNENGSINVGGFDRNGGTFAGHNLPLVQEDQHPPADAAYACWMPYQIATAKAEAALTSMASQPPPLDDTESARFTPANPSKK